MRRTFQTTLILSILLTIAGPSLAGGSPRYFKGTDLLHLDPRTVAWRGAEYNILRQYARSVTPTVSLTKLRAGQGGTALHQLQNFDRRRPFSSGTAQNPQILAFLNMVDIQNFMMSHGDSFPTPAHKEEFKKVLTVLVLLQNKQAHSAMQKQLKSLYNGHSTMQAPVALPARVEDIDAWMRNTPQEAQYATVHRELAPKESENNQSSAGNNTAPQTRTTVIPKKVVEKNQRLLGKFYQVTAGCSFPFPNSRPEDFLVLRDLLEQEYAGQLTPRQRETFLSICRMVLGIPDLGTKTEEYFRLKCWMTTEAPRIPSSEEYATAEKIENAPQKLLNQAAVAAQLRLNQLLFPKNLKGTKWENYDVFTGEFNNLGTTQEGVTAIPQSY